MAGIADDLADAFGSESWRDAAVPIVSNVTAEPLVDADRIRALLAEQVRSPVEWVAAVRRMAAGDADVYVECGAGAALVGMVRRIVPEAVTASVTDGASLDATVELLRARAEVAV
jgi:[acyl-carrier-protein] S-malonyltransferase